MTSVTSVRPYRLAIVSYHPMPYHVAFYRACHKDPRVDVTVLFLDDYGINAQYDPEFSSSIKWDMDIVEGYRSKFLKNIMFTNTLPLLMRVNPGLFVEIGKGEYDAVLITSYDTLSAQFALLAAKATGKKVLMRTEADLNNQSTPVRRWIKKILLGKIFSLCDALMYSCQANRQYFRHYGVRDEKLFPILSSVDNDFFKKISSDKSGPTKKRKKELRNDLRIPAEGVVFLFSGRHIERKRPFDLLESYARLFKEHPNAWLVSIGDGPLRPGLEKQAGERGLAQAIYPGFKNLSQITDYYLLADVFVQPSQYDPTPKALNEALVFGLPAIVSTGVGTAGDLVLHGENGMIVQTGDVTALHGAMESLLTNPEKRSAMGKKARRIVEKWSPQTNVEGLLMALDYCFKKAGRPS